MNVDGIPDYTWPYGQTYDFWPSDPCMEQMFWSLLLSVPHCSLSNAILEMGIYSTVDDVLHAFFTVSYKGIVSKAAIVTMVMLNVHTMTFGKMFEGFLGHDCFLSGHA